MDYTWFVGLVGLILGSFYACCGYRIPNKIPLTKARSFCPKCNKDIKWWMNIPVISYVFILRGKCHYCKEKISPMYPIIEILSCFLAVVGFIHFGREFNVEFLMFYTLCSAFIVTCVSDFKYYYVSDRVLVISAIIVFLCRLLLNGFEGALVYLLHGILMLLIMLTIRFLGNKAFKKESLGGGDIKIMGLVGLSIGLIPSLFALFFGSTIALPFAIYEMVAQKDEIVAFGPFLILGAGIIMYFYDPLLKLFNLFFNIV